MITYYYTVERIHSCTSDPLKYISQNLADYYDEGYVNVQVYTIKEDISNFENTEITFYNGEVSVTNSRVPNRLLTLP